MHKHATEKHFFKDSVLTRVVENKLTCPRGMPERSVKGFEPGSATLNANTQPLTPMLPTTKHGKRLERFESTEA